MDVGVYGRLDTATEIVRVQYEERVRQITVTNTTTGDRLYPSAGLIFPFFKAQGANTLTAALQFARQWCLSAPDRAVIIDKNYLGGHPIPQGDRI